MIVCKEAYLGGGREGTLGTFAGSTKTTEGTGVTWRIIGRIEVLNHDKDLNTTQTGDVLLVLALELEHEVVDETVIEILTTKMGVTSGGLNLEDTTEESGERRKSIPKRHAHKLLNGQERDIEGSSSEIEDKDVLLTLGLLVKTWKK